MPVQEQDQITSNIDVINDMINDSIVNANFANDNATPPFLSTARIPRVPLRVRETHDYMKYYVPKVVSIGPYHYGNPKLEEFEKLKPVFTMMLLKRNQETLKSLYNKLGEPEMVQELRSFYEEDSTTAYCDEVFTKMMLLDCCFILYCTSHESELYLSKKNYEGFIRKDIDLAHQDLFLLENQIPFTVLMEVTKLLEKNIEYLTNFIENAFLSSNRLRVRSRADYKISINAVHLLDFLHLRLTTKADPKKKDIYMTYTNFRNVSELLDVGIRFNPSSKMSLAYIKFIKGWFGFSANVGLPPIIVDSSTKPKLLNLIAYEMCSCSIYDAWVTSYVCLLNSLIDQPEDVKVLRKAWVLNNNLGNDIEVVKLFNEVATDLAPNPYAYKEVKVNIQKHYESWRNTLFPELKREYLKSPWAFFALVGALIALFLSGVQTYFTVWSPKSECDNLCKFLRMNHHL